MKKQLTEHLEYHSITNVLNAIICAIKKQNKKEYCVAVFVELVKALVTVNQNILLGRLKDIGLSESCLA